MKISSNKAALALFVADEQQTILAGGFFSGQLVKCITSTETQDLPELFSYQEEEDTRILLHATDLSSSHDCMVIQSDDIDVLVLLLFYASKNMLGSSVFMFPGHTTQTVSIQIFIPSFQFTLLSKTMATFSMKACQQHMHLLDVKQ